MKKQAIKVINTEITGNTTIVSLDRIPTKEEMDKLVTKESIILEF